MWVPGQVGTIGPWASEPVRTWPGIGDTGWHMVGDVHGRRAYLLLVLLLHGAEVLVPLLVYLQQLWEQGGSTLLPKPQTCGVPWTQSPAREKAARHTEVPGTPVWSCPPTSRRCCSSIFTFFSAVPTSGDLAAVPTACGDRCKVSQ